LGYKISPRYGANSGHASVVSEKSVEECGNDFGRFCPLLGKANMEGLSRKLDSRRERSGNIRVDLVRASNAEKRPKACRPSGWNENGGSSLFSVDENGFPGPEGSWKLAGGDNHRIAIPKTQARPGRGDGGNPAEEPGGE
jgi:hypothetical protein